jgi:glycosyltransferase involved in cell wall biosynthesis
VKFVNKYLSLDELLLHLKASDIYISSSLSVGQISSGTVAYAMGCGRPVVSTPFLHAKDAITPDRGILVDDFRKPELFSEAIIKILSNPSLKEKMEKNAYEYTRQMTWHNVATSYIKVFNNLNGHP